MQELPDTDLCIFVSKYEYFSKKVNNIIVINSNPSLAVGILHQGSYLIQISKLAFILLSTLRQNFKEERTFQSANMMFGCEE